MRRERHHRSIDRITDEASDWFVRLQDADPGADERAEFTQWLEASPIHVREYLQVAALWQDLEDLGPDPTAEELIRAARESGDENVVPLFSAPSDERAPTPGASRHFWRRGAAAAAAVILVALAAGVIWRGASPHGYRTGVGEQQSFVLSDGSVVTLNARSEIRVMFSAAHRDIVLVGGEALFEVAKDPERPFRVSTDGAVIRAVGTRFNVRSRNHDTTVTVVEGTVELTVNDSPQVASPNRPPAVGDSTAAPANPVELTVGQMARLDRRSGIVDVAAADVEQATAWRERRLVFESRSLAEVVDEFNLYNQPPMVISDPSIEGLQISGAFNANDPRSFVLFLEETGLASASTDAAGRITIRRPGDAAR